MAIMILNIKVSVYAYWFIVIRTLSHVSVCFLVIVCLHACNLIA